MSHRLMLASALVLACSIPASLALAADPKPTAAAPTAAAGTVEFDFTDMKGVNGVSFFADSALEPIVGFGGGVAGKVMWNPTDPKGVTGEITIPTKSLKTPNKGMDDAMYGADWLNAEKNPTISVKIKSIKEAKPGTNGVMDLTAVVDLSLAGVTKEMTIPVAASYMPGRLADRTGGRVKGDLLVLRTSFSLNRSDFGIQAGQIADVVGEKIEIRAAIAGARKEG
ncbi:MAG: YceI family protein [Phycisphaerales bacterium]